MITKEQSSRNTYCMNTERVNNYLCINNSIKITALCIRISGKGNVKSLCNSLCGGVENTHNKTFKILNRYTIFGRLLSTKGFTNLDTIF